MNSRQEDPSHNSKAQTLWPESPGQGHSCAGQDQLRPGHAGGNSNEE